MTGNAVPPLDENLDAVIDGLVAHDGLFVALDFDGTLAAIERRPGAVTIPDPTREVVARLAGHSAVAVAVVSGRELDDVRERVGVSGVAYAGNHGLELHAGEYVVHPAAEDTEATVSAVCERLADELADVEGAIVEDKGVTATVHHRLVTDEAVPAVEAAVESAVAPRDDIVATTGKDVLELRPAVEWDKGEAVDWHRDELVPDDETWFPVYVGDDTTDEAAFDALPSRGLGVKVGTDTDTAAGYRVADPDTVQAVLSWLATDGVDFLTAADAAVAGDIGRP